MVLSLEFPEGGAFVAGGTGNVGVGVVTALARCGLPVAFTYRSNEQKAKELEAALGEQGWNAKALQMEMLDPASIDAALDAAEGFAGTLRTIACTSGARVPFDRLADFDIADVEAFVDGDAMAYFRLFNRVMPRLRAAGGGSITVTTTVATSRVLDWDGISAFSKGAVQAMIRQVAAEEGQHGIRCNDVGISWAVELDIADAGSVNEAMPPPIGERLAELTGQLRDRRRVPHSGLPIDAGYLFAFLASEQAAFITGQTINLDGGITL